MLGIDPRGDDALTDAVDRSADVAGRHRGRSSRPSADRSSGSTWIGPRQLEVADVEELEPGRRLAVETRSMPRFSKIGSDGRSWPRAWNPRPGSCRSRLMSIGLMPGSGPPATRAQPVGVEVGRVRHAGYRFSAIGWSRSKPNGLRVSPDGRLSVIEPGAGRRIRRGVEGWRALGGERVNGSSQPWTSLGFGAGVCTARVVDRLRDAAGRDREERPSRPLPARLVAARTSPAACRVFGDLRHCQ